MEPAAAGQGAGSVQQVFLQRIQQPARLHGDEQGLPRGQQGGKGLQSPSHPMGLHGQKDPVTLPGDGIGVRVDNPQRFGKGRR